MVASCKFNRVSYRGGVICWFCLIVGGVGCAGSVGAELDQQPESHGVVVADVDRWIAYLGAQQFDVR